MPTAGFGIPEKFISPQFGYVFYLLFIMWLRLTRTGNYQIHDFDIVRGLDFPI